MTEHPIEPEYVEKMRTLGRFLQDEFKPYGFCLLVFPLGDADGRMNYISNAKRKEMLIAMKEFIAHNEGRVMDGSKDKQ